jgi:hypothetical protein
LAAAPRESISSGRTYRTEGGVGLLARVRSGPVPGARKMDTLGVPLGTFLAGTATRRWFTLDLESTTWLTRAA